MDPLLVAALLLGAFTGFAAGLPGIGGGMLMAPFMTMLPAGIGFPADRIVKVAIATSLTTIVFTSMSSVRAHHRRGAVRWDVVRSRSPAAPPAASRSRSPAPWATSGRADICRCLRVRSATSTCLRSRAFPWRAC